MVRTLSSEAVAVVTTPVQVRQHTCPPASALPYPQSTGSSPHSTAASYVNIRWPLGKVQLCFTFLSEPILIPRMAKARLFFADFIPAQHCVCFPGGDGDLWWSQEERVWEPPRMWQAMHSPCYLFASFGISINLVPSQCVVQTRHSNVFVEWIKTLIRWSFEWE